VAVAQNDGAVILEAHKLVDGASVFLAKSMIEFIADRAENVEHRGAISLASSQYECRGDIDAMPLQSEKVIRWLVFGSLISILPLVYAWMDLRVRGETATFQRIIGNGELLVIVWVLAASAIGELFGSKGTNPKPKIFFGGITFALIIVSALFFASITEAREAKTNLDGSFVVVVSIIFYLASLVPCSYCLYWSEL
jgi:hypothetical protein